MSKYLKKRIPQISLNARVQLCVEGVDLNV
jgi:hypothetical protein